MRTLKRITIATLAALVLAAGAWADEAAILTIAYEASGESYEGQIAVGNVIKTRAHKRRQTPEQVVKAPHQFSAWHPVTGKPTQSRHLTKAERLSAKAAWDASKVWEYDHYCRFDVSPYWVKYAIKSKRIGNHIFYVLSK